jgi:hypothetical protein
MRRNDELGAAGAFTLYFHSNLTQVQFSAAKFSALSFFLHKNATFIRGTHEFSVLYDADRKPK